MKRAERDADKGKNGGKLDLGVESPKLIIAAPQYLKRVRVRARTVMNVWLAWGYVFSPSSV